MPINNVATFNRWAYCDRCGFARPENTLVLQKGLRVCVGYPTKCYDDLTIEQRDREIQMVLESESSQQQDSSLFEDSGELRFS